MGNTIWKKKYIHLNYRCKDILIFINRICIYRTSVSFEFFHHAFHCCCRAFALSTAVNWKRKKFKNNCVYVIQFLYQYNHCVALSTLPYLPLKHSSRCFRAVTLCSGGISLHSSISFFAFSKLNLPSAFI